MWNNLDESIGKVLLVVAVGGGALYGLTKVINAPPLLRQSNQIGPSPYAATMIKETEARLQDIQEQQAEAFRNAADVRDRAFEAVKP